MGLKDIELLCRAVSGLMSYESVDYVALGSEFSVFKDKDVNARVFSLTAHYDERWKCASEEFWAVAIEFVSGRRDGEIACYFYSKAAYKDPKDAYSKHLALSQQQP